MSLLETVCPHCGKSMVFSPIDYINTEERPKMIQKVRDGEAFVSICGHCGKKSRMDYSFLYYQPSALFLVYYAADQEDYEKAWKMLTGQDRERRLRKRSGMMKPFLFIAGTAVRLLYCIIISSTMNRRRSFLSYAALTVPITRR